MNRAKEGGKVVLVAAKEEEEEEEDPNENVALRIKQLANEQGGTCC
jgi:hypothetical protein